MSHRKSGVKPAFFLFSGGARREILGASIRAAMGLTALAKPKRPGRVAKMFEVQFSEARIEQVSKPSVGEA
jgi:hypothetical protein